jgi:hypothetical protein
MDMMDAFMNAMAAEPVWKLYLVGALVAVLVVVVLWNRLKQPSQMLAFTTERGRVYISRRAISEMISRVAARTSGVEKCRNRLKDHKGKLRIYLYIHIKADADLREIERKLEIHITDIFNRNLGFDSIESFNTKATSVVGELDDLRTVTRSGLKSEAELNIHPVETPGKQSRTFDS